MSRGLGRIGRAIAENIAFVRPKTGRPDPVQISSRDLLMDVYNPENRALVTFTMAQRKAVVRAMKGFVRRFPCYALTGGQGRSLLVLYEPGDPLSREACGLPESTTCPAPVRAIREKTGVLR